MWQPVGQVVWFISHTYEATKDGDDVGRVRTPKWIRLPRLDCAALEAALAAGTQGTPNRLCWSCRQSWSNPSVPVTKAFVYIPACSLQDRCLILGNLHEADIAQRLAYPVYWTDQPRHLVR